jgi:MATE family multidrug resistance protein
LLRAVKLCALWSVVLAGLATLFFLVAGGPILDFMTPAEDVRALGREFLIFAALTPIVGVGAFLMDGVYIGATWSRDMRNMMLISLAVFLAAAYTLTPAMGNTGLWLSFLFSSACAVSPLGLSCRGGCDQTFSGRPVPGHHLNGRQRRHRSRVGAQDARA